MKSAKAISGEVYTTGVVMKRVTKEAEVELTSQCRGPPTQEIELLVAMPLCRILAFTEDPLLHRVSYAAQL